MITEADIQRIFKDTNMQAFRRIADHMPTMAEAVEHFEQQPKPAPFMRRASDKLPVVHDNDLDAYIASMTQAFPVLDAAETLLED